MLLRCFNHYIKNETILSARMNRTKKIIHSQHNTCEGKNIGIAVLDTGISPVDDFLLPNNRIVAFRDFVNGRDSPYDDNGHGTHVWCRLKNFCLIFVFIYYKFFSFG